MLFLFLFFAYWVLDIDGLTDYGPGCSVNETVSTNGTRSSYEIWCNHLPARYLDRRDTKHERKCHCKKGYYRDHDLYDCVLPNDCTCVGENQVRSCTKCEPTCQEPNKTCPVTKCSAKRECICAPGTVRNMGYCQPENSCLRCGPRERYVRHGGCEEKNCLEPNKKDSCPEIGEPASSDLSIYPQCLCLPGYVRSTNEPITIRHYSIGTDAKCVELKDCPNKTINGNATITSTAMTTINETCST